MKKIYRLISTALFILFILCILLNSKVSMFYAMTGLKLWFEKMIPALLPFMIISGIMVRMNITESFTTLAYPFIRPVFRVSKNVCYCMILGFLCGFPMGAKTVAEMLDRKKITYNEAVFLLCFVNNIGPVYFVGFVLPLLKRKLIYPYIFGMYGIPFLYGLFLRYTIYGRKISLHEDVYINSDMSGFNILCQIEDSIQASVASMLNLSGYMILFNLLNIFPHILFGETSLYLAPVFEISGGLSFLKDSCPLYTLLILPFGGLSCIAQTYSCIKDTKIKISLYTLHKLILTTITALFYLLWYISSSSSFLR